MTQNGDKGKSCWGRYAQETVYWRLAEEEDSLGGIRTDERIPRSGATGRRSFPQVWKDPIPGSFLLSIKPHNIGTLVARVCRNIGVSITSSVCISCGLIEEYQQGNHPKGHGTGEEHLGEGGGFP
jgi:hypothetical protein